MPPAIPRATYRVQLSADFGFDQVAAIVPYLQALGVKSSLRIAVPQGTSWIEARL